MPQIGKLSGGAASFQSRSLKHPCFQEYPSFTFQLRVSDLEGAWIEMDTWTTTHHDYKYCDSLPGGLISTRHIESYPKCLWLIIGELRLFCEGWHGCNLVENGLRDDTAIEELVATLPDNFIVEKPDNLINHIVELIDSGRVVLPLDKVLFTDHNMS